MAVIPNRDLAFAVCGKTIWSRSACTDGAAQHLKRNFEQVGPTVRPSPQPSPRWPGEGGTRGRRIADAPTRQARASLALRGGRWR